MPNTLVISVVEAYTLVLARSSAWHLAHSARTSPSSATIPSPVLASAQAGGIGTSSEGDAGPNGVDGVPNLPSLYSTTTVA